MCVKNISLLVGTLVTQLHKCIMQHTPNAAHTQANIHQLTNAKCEQESADALVCVREKESPCLLPHKTSATPCVRTRLILWP